MLRYALQTIAARRAGFVGAFLALLCAAALVTACGTLLETGLRGEIDTERYAATPVVVAGDQRVHRYEDEGDEIDHKAKPIGERVWLGEDVLDRVASAPGVARAVPEITFPATVVDPGSGTFHAGPDDGPSLGHAWTSAALTPFTLDEGRAPGADDEVVVDRGVAARAGLSVGDEVTVQATGVPTPYTVAGIASATSAPGGELEQQAALFFAPDEARRLAGHAAEHAVIGVMPEDGVSTGELVDALDAALEGTTAQVHDDDLGGVEFLDAAEARVELISMGGAIGGTAILVAVLVVVGTVALSIQQRQRELALLRAVAATPRQVRRLVGREALVVGLVAGIVGALAGLPLGAWLHGRFVAFGTIPDTLDPIRSPFPLFVAVLGALAAAWVAARIAGRRAARIRPAEALADAAVDGRRLSWGRALAGVAVLALGVVLLAVLTALHTEPAAMPVTYLSVLALSIALALLGPTVARAALGVLGAPLRASRVAGHLAAHNARANARRLAAAITPLTLLVGMGCTIVFVQTTLRDAAERETRDGIVAERVVASAGPGVPGEAAERLRDTAGVTAVTEVVRTAVRTPGLDEYDVQGVTPEGLAATIDPEVTEGSLDDLAEGGVAVSGTVADARGIGPGDELDVVMGDGTPAELTVVAVYDRALGFGDLTMAHEQVVEHVDNPLADAVLVAGEVEDDAVTAALAEFPGVRVADGGYVADQRAAAQEANAEVSYVAMGLILAFTAIASVNTLAQSTADRSREFALLRLVGTTRQQILRMLRLESLVAVLAAVVLGTVVSFLTVGSFSVGMTGQARPSFSPAPYLVVVATAAALALVATAASARVALRERPADAIGAE